MNKEKTVWLMNHYGANMYYNRGGRHYWFAKNLIKRGYRVFFFAANVRHNTDDIIPVKDGRFAEETLEGIRFVFVETPTYKGNKGGRVKNMYAFYRNLFPVTKRIREAYGAPDLILASSVHPLTLVAGIRIGKKLGVPCIAEVRDLWPESIVQFQGMKREGLLTKILYQGEKWIYKKADRLIFTMEGGGKYIQDQGWDKESGGPVDLEKVEHINNGIDLQAFDESIREGEFHDPDLEDPNTVKIVYAGSIRRANKLEILLKGAKYVQNHRRETGGSKLEGASGDIRVLVYGDGEERITLEKRCKDEGISSVIFKGKVEKSKIPFILSKADIAVLNYANHDIWKYGGSQNKNFEYLASGTPILSTIIMGYDLIERHQAGISLEKQTAEAVGKGIMSIMNLSGEERSEMGKRARKAAEEYDFKKLTDQLERIIKETLRKGEESDHENSID